MRKKICFRYKLFIREAENFSFVLYLCSEIPQPGQSLETISFLLECKTQLLYFIFVVKDPGVKDKNSVLTFIYPMLLFVTLVVVSFSTGSYILRWCCRRRTNDLFRFFFILFLILQV